MLQWSVLLCWVLLLLPTMGIIVQHVRDWVRLRRAGVSALRPGCPKCRYLVRGWTSSICPECGTNVSVEGVVIKPVASRTLAMLTAGMWGLVLCGLIAFPLCSSLFKERQWTATLNLSPTTARQYAVMILTTGAKRRWPPSESLASQIQFTNGKAVSTLSIAPGDELPMRQELMTAISTVVDGQPPSLLESQAMEILAALRQQREAMDSFYSSLNRGGFNQAGGSTSSRSDISPLGTVIALVLTLGGAIILIWLARRMCPNGRRPVHDGEWASPGD